MLRPTLLVGIGTSGLQVLSEVQQSMYETFGVNKLPIFEYVYLETDVSQAHEVTPAGSDLIPVHLRVQSLSQAYKVLNNNPQLSVDWMPPNLPSQLAYNAQGAGGVRPAGRLLLWGEGNFGRVHRAFEEALERIQNPAATAKLRQDFPDLVERAGLSAAHNAVVYVVGTLVGGTASGTFIDIGYMLRRIAGMGETGPLYGIFMLPRDCAGRSMGCANAYGALEELEYFRRADSRYEENWPDGLQANFDGLPPYAIVYLVSPEYGRGDMGHMRLDGCYKVTALRLFCDLLGLTSHRGAVLEDGMNEGFGFYATFGIAAVMHPKYALIEGAGCVQGRALCDRWLAGQHYFTADGERIPINELEILNAAESFVGHQVKRAVETLSTKGAAPGGLRLDIASDVQRIVKNEEGHPVQFLATRLTGGRGGNYYSAVSGNTTAAQDQLIGAIGDYVRQRTEDCESFEYVEVLLRSIRQALAATLEFWTQLGVPDGLSEWNAYVARAVEQVLDRPNRLLGLKPDTLEDRLNNLLNVLMTSQLRRVVLLVKDSLDNGNLATSDQSRTLPTVATVTEAKRQMQAAREALQRREQEIAKDVSDTSVAIQRVWHAGSYEADRSAVIQAYKARYGISSVKDVSQGTATWDFVMAMQEPKRFQQRIKVGYGDRLRGLLPTVDVVGQAMQHVDTTRQYAERALAGLLKLNLRAKQGEHGVPRFVLGSDTGALNALVKRLSASGLHDLRPGADGHVRQLPLLDHAVVFYEEKAQINVPSMLSICSALKTQFETPATDATGQRIMDADAWTQQRLAYGITRREQVNRCRDLITFLLDFAIVWQRAGGRWQSIQARWTDPTIKLGAPPRLQYRDHNSVTRETELSTDLRHIRDLADRSGDREALSLAGLAIVKAHGARGLADLFEAEVIPYLKQLGSEDQVKSRTKLYFGDSSDPNGLIHRLLAEASPA